MQNSGRKIRSIIIWTLLSSIAVLAGCSDTANKKKEFSWDSEVASMTGKDLKEWLRKAPFQNELKAEGDNKILFTNAEQVFPFIGKYYNSVELQRINSGNPQQDHIYQTESILFQDPKWGDLFVNGVLLYSNDELFLNNGEVSMGDPLFEGKDAVFNTYHSDLSETQVHSKTDNSKNALYWGYASNRSFLLAFYQKANLAFEAVIPLINNDSLGTLNKLKELEQAMGLKIPEWANATVDQIAATSGSGTFWNDPFLGIFMVKQFMPSVFLNMRYTDFKEQPSPEDSYTFKAMNGSAEADFKIALVPNSLDKESFEKQHKDLPHYEYFYQKTYYQEEQQGDRTVGKAYCFYTKDKSLEINFSYPSQDEKLKSQVHMILKYLKVNTTMVY